MAYTGTLGPLHAALSRCGATFIERDGRLVAAHYGSPATEAAICQRAVGMIDRSDRRTLEVRGAPEVVDQALDALAADGFPAWSGRVAPGCALVRCEVGHADAVSASLRSPGVASVFDVGDDYAAIGLIGPRAEEPLRAAGNWLFDTGAVVVCEASLRLEVLVPANYGPALWEHLLEVGGPFDLACVGLEALGHLTASQRLAQPAPELPG